MHTAIIIPFYIPTQMGEIGIKTKTVQYNIALKSTGIHVLPTVNDIWDKPTQNRSTGNRLPIIGKTEVSFFIGKGKLIDG